MTLCHHDKYVNFYLFLRFLRNKLLGFNCIKVCHDLVTMGKYGSQGQPG